MKLKLKHDKSSYETFDDKLDEMLSQLPDNSVIIEIGGGANPALPKNTIIDKEFKYIVIDVSQVELDKGKDGYYRKICTDITHNILDIKADFIFSKMLLEHIPNPKDFHQAIFSLLKANGIVMHFYATLYNPVSIANLLLPEKLGFWLLSKLQKRDWDKEGKFPAYYRWSYGPTKKQINQLLNIGYKVEEFYGFYGMHYFTKVPIFRSLEKLYNKMVRKYRSPFFTSNALVVLSNPV